VTIHYETVVGKATTFLGMIHDQHRSTLDLRMLSSVTEYIMFVAYISFNKQFKKNTAVTV